jgi:hypothetical protein
VAANDNPSQLRWVRLIADVTSPILGGVFYGRRAITEFSVDEAGQLSVTGLLDGVATISGVPTIIKRQPFPTAAVLGEGVAAPAAGCTLFLLHP